MATEMWAKEVEGTGLTINIVNPGASANTPGMAEEMRMMSREGRAPRLVEPEEMGRLARSRHRQRLALRRQPLGPGIADRSRNRLEGSTAGYSSRKPARRRPTYSVFARRAMYAGLV